MGDHRASIKIEMEFHGVKDSCDMWINYTPTDCCNMDSRVLKFFERIYNQGMAKYDAEVAAYEWERTKEQREAEERSELARLKAKYETEAEPGREG